MADKKLYCEYCTVVEVKRNQRYCEACVEEMLNWLYAAEQQEQDMLEEQQYLAEVTEKHSNYHYES